jgi:hypothetical protein
MKKAWIRFETIRYLCGSNEPNAKLAWAFGDCRIQRAFMRAIAQHATATCCRECIRKWHKLQPGCELSQVQQDYLVDVIMTWIEKEYADAAKETD